MNKKYLKIVRGINSKNNRQVDDYYSTSSHAVELLLKHETFSEGIIEPACGEGHISKILERHGYDVLSSDLIDRDYGVVSDFLAWKNNKYKYQLDIITNPPFKLSCEFIEKANEVLDTGKKIALFFPLIYLQGKKRNEVFKKYPIKRVLIPETRTNINVYKNGDESKNNGFLISFAWFIWEVGYKGETTIKMI